ncbi:Vomeronasal type-1 receptor A16 [Fukomys damarensis]|uniref:Vomeronasal type-1 receptor n=1 Tax=Fukomys damarensis TaxID=885580 RepID=A0A091ELB0_FUKDA|nr:Vomeronasal type-1 receptor A16 [Fukomys damarensis]
MHKEEFTISEEGRPSVDEIDDGGDIWDKELFFLFFSDIFSFSIKVNKKKSFASLSDIRNMVFFEITIGVVANTVLLLFHILKFLLKQRPKPLDLSIGHLALIHLVMLVTVGLVATDTFGFQGWEKDLTCKLVIYVNRLMRALSLCTTCLLSVLQAIALSPRNSCLAKFKHRSTHHYPCFLVFLWIFTMLLNGRLLVFIGATPNVTSHSLMFVTESCSHWPIKSLFRYIFLTLANTQDVSFIGLMALSSGYMVTLLCRHKRRLQHLHSTSLYPKTSPEERATQTILLLMGFFTFIYFLDCITFSSSAILWKNDPIHHYVQMLVGNSYATGCPLVLMSTEKRMTKWLTSRWKRLNV